MSGAGQSDRCVQRGIANGRKINKKKTHYTIEELRKVVHLEGLGTDIWDPAGYDNVTFDGIYSMTLQDLQAALGRFRGIRGSMFLWRAAQETPDGHAVRRASVSVFHHFSALREQGVS